MPVAVKICGLNSSEAVKASVDNGATYTGFIFYPPSPRYISSEQAAEFAAFVPPSVKKVAVTVNVTDTELQKIITAIIPDFLQLHGNESAARIAEIKKRFGIPIIKAINVKSAENIDSAAIFTSVADMILFDAKSSGSGRPFDWNLLKGRNFNISWMLSGGLNLDNIAEAIEVTSAQIVDLSSGLETAPGKKSPELIEKFMRKVHEI